MYLFREKGSLQPEKWFYQIVGSIWKRKKVVSLLKKVYVNLHASYWRLFNPLISDMKMRILHTVLHIFLVELVRRICLNIKTPYPS